MKVVIAFYEKAEQAQQASQELSQIGIAASEIGVLPSTGSNGQGLLNANASGEELIETLDRFGLSKDEAALYAEGLERGGGFIVARVKDEKAEEAASALDRTPLADIEVLAEQWERDGGEQVETPGLEGETVQAVEEELQVGKRETPGASVRIRSHVEERPVEERIRLREEELNVDRKPTDRTLRPEEAEKAFQEHTVEVTATRERPVVSKQARVVEEVTISKTEREREEVVRDTVRSKKLKVEQDDRVKQDS